MMSNVHTEGVILVHVHMYTSTLLLLSMYALAKSTWGVSQY